MDEWSLEKTEVHSIQKDETKLQNKNTYFQQVESTKISFTQIGL